MAKIIKNVTVTWTWSGDTYALKGFNLMVLPSGQTPTDGTIQVLASANQVPAESRSYSFNNLTLDTAVTYVPWVQAFYENDDSDWVSSTGFAVSDDGQNTLTTRVEAEGYAATALDEAKKLVPAIVGTQTATTGAWVGVAPFATLTNGQQVNYWLPYNGSGSATLNLTLSGGGTTGAIPCYYGGTTRLTTHYGAGSSILLTYRVNASINGTLYTGWWAQPSFYADTYDRTCYYQSMKATEAITAGQLMMSDDLGYKKILNSRTYDVTKPILWAGSNISANGSSNNNYTVYPGVSLTSTIAGISFTSTKVVYIRGTLSGTNFTTNATAANVFTDTPTDDGVSTYIALGQLYSTTNILLYAEHPLFKFSEGVFKSFAQIAAEAQATADSKSKTFPSGTNPSNYKIGDLWQDGQQVKVATATSATYNSGHWVLAGDVTGENTSKDTTMVGGTAAATIVSGVSAGTTANSTVTANKSTWDRASSFDASGNLATTKLTGTVTDTQIASATAWNNAKTLVTDITTDGKLTPFEKQTLKPEYDAILKEKIEAVTLATSYGALTESYYTNYINAYNALYGGMNTMMTTNIASNSAIDRDTMNGWFTNYYEKAAIFQRNINEAARTIASGAATSASTANELAKAMTSGKLLYKDPVFAYGTNSINVYNNSANSNVVHTRITKPTDAPTNSTHLIEIKNIGTASPGIGGFVQNLTARANAKFVVRYIAKIPVGYTITTASNSMGNGYTDTFLTATAGTGKYEEYIRVVQCGVTGDFSTGGHVYLNGAVGSAGTPVVWYLARIDAYDVTSYESFASHINDDPDTQRIEGKKMHFTNEVLMDDAWINNLVANSIVVTKIQATELNAGKITAGTLSADRIAAGSLSGDKITANTIDATRLKIGSGAQGGYINNPRFTAWSGAYPDGTSLWSAGGISKVTVDTVPMAQFATAAGAQQGMQLSSSYFANGIDLDGMQYFALECRFRLTSGTNPAGASFLVDIYRQDNSYERMQLDMKEVATSVTTNTWYVARKVFKLSDANVAKTFKSVGGYLMANWSGAGDAAKTIQFASVNMFQASAQEYLAQSWTNSGSTVINGGMIATGTINAEKIYLGTGNVAAGNLNAGKTLTGTGSGTVATDGSKAVGSSYQEFGTGTGTATSGAEGSYIQVDLGSAYRIAQSKTYWYSQDTRVYFYKIKYSTDGTNWYYAVGNSNTNGWMVSAKNVSAGNPSVHPTVDTFSLPISARYVRLYGNGNTSNGNNHIYEWELFSSAETVIHGDMIQTGTVSASKISIGTLPNNVLSGITSDKFATTVQTTLTNAGTAYNRTEDWKSAVDSTYIDGGNIYTGTITAEKVLLGDPTNLVSINELTGSVHTNNFGSVSVSGNYIQKTLSSSAYLMFNDYLPVMFNPGEELYYEFYAQADAAVTASLNLWYYNSAKANTGVTGAQDISLTTTEKKFSGTINTGSFSLDTTSYYLVGLANTNNRVVKIRRVVVRRKGTGELIVDGSITSEKMYAGKIGSRNDKSWIDFNNGAFSLADGKLTWTDNELTVNGTVSANNIKGGTFMAKNGISTINMDTGSFNFGNADKYIKFDAGTGNLDMVVNNLKIGSSNAVSESKLEDFKTENVDPVTDFVNDSLKTQWAALIGALKVTENDISIQVPGSTNRIQITGDTINFINQGVVVAKITDQKLSINNGLFLENVILGAHSIKKYGTGNSAVTVFEYMNADNLTI